MADNLKTTQARKPTPETTWLDGPRVCCLALILISLSLSFARLLETPALQSANDKSRWCTVHALVERKTYIIDEEMSDPLWHTIDNVRHEGHFYSTKPPLFPTLVAGLYWLEKSTLGWTLESDLNATARLLLVVVNFLPWGLALWIFSETIRRIASSRFTTIWITAIAAMATLLTPFLVTLNNHVPAAVCVIFALSAAMRITVQKEQRWLSYILCGLFAALAACFELPAAAFGLAIFLLLFFQDRLPTLKWFLPAAAVPLLAFFLTNLLATGGLRPFYMFYGTEKYLYVHQGRPSYWLSPRGIDQAKDSTLSYLLHCTIGHHGILSLTPVYLITILGWLIGIRKKDSLRDYLLMGLGLTLLVLGYFLTRTQNYNYGGNSVALRWMLWLVPFWLLAMIPAVDFFQNKRWFRVVSLLLLLPSVFSAWYPYQGPWTSPWLLTLMQKHHWVDYSDPKPSFGRDVYSWLYQVPDGPHDPDYWIELASVDAQGRTSVMKISDGGPVLLQGGRTGRRILLERTAGSFTSPVDVLTIDTEALRAGKPIAEFVVWPNGTPDARIVHLLSGLPQQVKFFPLRKTYKRAAGVRDDFFECIIGGVEITRDPQVEGWQRRKFRSQIVLSKEVPFGVLKVEISVHDATGRSLHALERWAIRRSGKFLPRENGSGQLSTNPSQQNE